MDDFPFPKVLTMGNMYPFLPMLLGVQILSNNDTNSDGIHKWVTIQVVMLYSGVPRACVGYVSTTAEQDSLYRLAAGTMAESHDHDRAIFSTRSISSPDTSPFHTLNTVSSSSMQRRIASVPWSATNDR